jgi:hypothetical protein
VYLALAPNRYELVLNRKIVMFVFLMIRDPVASE